MRHDKITEEKRGKLSGERDPLFLFLCHIAWRDRKDIEAYQVLVAALDDSKVEIRELAEHLLHRASPRPRQHGPRECFWQDSE